MIKKITKENYESKLLYILNNLFLEATTGSTEWNKNKLKKKQLIKIKALVDEGKSYKDLFNKIYQEEDYLNDFFIKIIENTEGVNITSSKQLQELTGITEVYLNLNSNKITKKEAGAEAIRQIEAVFIKGMYNRYFTTLEDMLEAGAKYKDIVLLNPKEFNLPNQWSGTLAKNKEEAILWAISFTYLLNEQQSLNFLPSLRTVAEYIEAPYSVLMNCNKLFNK